MVVGVISVRLFSLLCIDVGLYLLKGYSISLLLEVGDVVLVISVMDVVCKIVYVCIGQMLCVVGMVDLVGWLMVLDMCCVQMLYDEMCVLFLGVMCVNDVGVDVVFWVGMWFVMLIGVLVVGLLLV